MTSTTDIIDVGPWRAERMTGRLVRDGEIRDLEPKVMDLLFLLADRRGEVMTREAILSALWPGVTVGEDTLSRTVFKLRRALDDDPKAPRFVETLPKRGYRLLAEAASPTPRRRLWPLAAGLAALLVLGPLVWRLTPTPVSETTRRADDAYFQYTRADNEAAVVLYERALAANPRDAEALAGLANALVQQVLRWPDGTASPSVVRMDIRTALADGRTRTPAAVARLERAHGLAEDAVRMAPRNSTALRALGLVLSAQGRLPDARAVYEKALGVDPRAWGVMMNLAEVYDLTGEPARSTASMQAAYAAMSRAYDRESARIRPWHAALGVRIAERLAAAGDRAGSEAWYRKVLAEAPLDPAATRGLAGLLKASGKADQAGALCADFKTRTGVGC
jgi:DNA-binding winged helix-turn-helix (wHTH) protein